MSCVADQGWRKRKTRRHALLGIFLLGFVSLFIPSVRAQTAYISDAWWTYQQDCNGDGCKAGTLPGDMARLNWASDVTNCDGTLTVFEIVYSKPCGSTAWTAIFTSAPHSITGCRSIGADPSANLPMSPGCACKDYKIEVYRQGMTHPDYVRSGTNDVDLAQHKEQLLSEDYCLSDFFATCVSLSGASGSQFDNNSYATKEPGEPNHAGNAGGHSLWYCWTAPTNTSVNFDTIGSTFDTLLAVYMGDVVSNLTLVACQDDIAGATDRLSRVTFTPKAGTTYHIAVDGFGGATGDVVLNWNQTGSPLADLVIWGQSANPIIFDRTFSATDCEVVEGCEVPGTRRLLSFNTETRNIGSGDLVLGNPATNSLFVWAKCHQHYHFEKFAEYHLLDLSGNVVTNAFGHKVGFCMEDYQPWAPNAPPAKYNCTYQGIQAGWSDVYSGYIPNQFIGVACQYMDITDVPPGDYSLQLIVNPDGLLPESNYGNNTTYVPIRIPPATSDCPSPPINDNFANGTVISNTPWSSVEFTQCATTESGEPDHLGVAAGHSVWFTWTPTSNQTAVVSTKRSDFDTILAVYTGDTVSDLTLVASNDDIIPGIFVQSELSFQAVAGTTYHIVGDGYLDSSAGPSVGALVLNVNPPSNDDFANAWLLAGGGGTTNSYNVGASKEAQEPAHAGDVGGHSIWFTWTAPATGPVNFDTSGSDYDTTLAVYTGVAVDELTTIASNDDDAEGAGLVTSRLWFNAVAGTTYMIAVDGFGGVTGNVVLNWNMVNQMNIASLPNGGCQVSFTGVDWQRYQILESSDLINWITNSTITMSHDLHVSTNDTSTPMLFYQTKLVP
jgi:hypothetical protein